MRIAEETGRCSRQCSPLDGSKGCGIRVRSSDCVRFGGAAKTNVASPQSSQELYKGAHHSWYSDPAHRIEPAITSDDVEVKGSPVSQQHRLASLPFICLDVSAAGFAVVDPQASLSLDRHDRKSVIVFTSGKTDNRFAGTANVIGNNRTREIGDVQDQYRPTAPWRRVPHTVGQ